MTMFPEWPRAWCILRSLCALAVLGPCAGAGAQSDAGDSAPSVHVQPPSDAYLADVTASGTGCPAGTWFTGLAADGKSFITRFRGFHMFVHPGQTIAVRDCAISIRLNTPYAGSYALGNVYYTALVNLSAGVYARLEAAVFFLGARDQGTTTVLDVAGPQNRWYVTKVSESESPVRSGCGSAQTLGLHLTVTLRSTTTLGAGDVYENEFPSESEPGMTMIWKRCDPEPIEPSSSAPAPPT
jgi:hypothetical protein